MRSVPPRGSGWVCPKKRSRDNQMLSALLLRQLQPTRYREVVLTSLHRRNSLGNRPFFLSNTLTEHCSALGSVAIWRYRAYVKNANDARALRRGVSRLSLQVEQISQIPARSAQSYADFYRDPTLRARIFSWPSRRPRNSMQPSNRRRPRSPVR